MTKRRTGLSGLSYMGVEATTPPQLSIYNRAPTANDYKNFDIGHIWIYDTVPQQVWMLTNKDNHASTWRELDTSGAVGTITQVDGGDNINTVNPLGPIVTVNLDESIFQPVTSADGLQGLYALGGNTFMHSIGTQNTFLGQSAGNLNLTIGNARRNTGIGYQALTENLSGEMNVAIGESALATLLDGDRNVAIGHGSLDQATDLDFSTAVGGDSLTQLLTGDYNTVLGYRAGFDLVGAESDNILIGSEGVIGDGNTIRIGTQGAGAGQQDTTFIAGIHGVAVGGTNEIMYVDDDGQVGSSAGTDGQLLIGGTGVSPIWANMLSAGGTVLITYPAPNQINLESAGGGAGGSTTFNTDVAGPAVIVGNVINVLGDGIIQTDGTVANTVTVQLPDGANGELLIGGGGAAPVWGTVTAGAGINIVNAANSITISAPGAGGGSTTFNTDLLGPAVVVAGDIDILGGTNITTSGAGQVVTVEMDGSIALPDTNAAGTQGVYKLASGTTFMHNFGVAGASFNTFLGQDAGNLATLTASVDCTGIGYESLNSLVTGSGNSCLGSGSGKDITAGNYNVSAGDESLFQLNAGDHNVAIGRQNLHGIVTGEYNISLGSGSGSNCTGIDSSNILIGHAGVAGLNNTIRIGTQGAGAGQQDTTYMAGIHSVAPAGGGQLAVIIDANGQMGTHAGGIGDVTAVNGGTNITTVNAGGPVVTVNLDDNVTLLGDLVAVDGTFSGLGRGVVQSTAAGVLFSDEGTDGQVLISSSAAEPDWAAITGGTGITITPGSHSIDISANGGLDIDAYVASHTLVIGNAGNEVIITNAAAVNLTVPTNAAVAFPVGTQIILVQGGAGTVTVVPGGGVTINSAGGRLDLYEQYSSAALIKQAINTWLLVGDIK